MIFTKGYQFIFVMDPYESLNFKTETSLLLMQELLLRGQTVYWVEIDKLFLKQNRLFGLVQQVESMYPFKRSAPTEMSLDEMDALLMRKDPPFDQNYLHATYLLDFLSPSVIQINSARSVRDANEKIFGLNWPDLVPPTLTTMQPRLIERFVKRHRKAVLKPLDNCSGRGIVLLDSEDPELLTKIHDAISDSSVGLHYVTVQKFLEAIYKGDKRVYLVNGEPVGIVNRIPVKGQFLGNIHAGAHCEASELTDKERQVIKQIAPMLREKGLFLVGLDLIGERITEINVTSASAVIQINEVTGKNLGPTIVSAMLSYISQAQTLAQAKIA